MIANDISFKNDVAWSTLLDIIYPVGTLYSSTSDTSPASIFGGSWSQLDGAVLRAAQGCGYEGSDTHTITTTEMPSHYHNTRGWVDTENQGHTHWIEGWTWENGDHGHRARLTTMSWLDGSYSFGYGGGYPDRAVARDTNFWWWLFKDGNGSTSTIENNGNHQHYMAFSSGNISQNHQHWFNIDSSSSGGGAAMSMLPRYYNHYCWVRTA